MTNEEKALAICEEASSAYDAALEMAAWKDEVLESVIKENGTLRRRLAERNGNMYDYRSRVIAAATAFFYDTPAKYGSVDEVKERFVEIIEAVKMEGGAE